MKPDQLPQDNNNERKFTDSSQLFQSYIDDISEMKKKMIAYLDSLNFSDFHERSLDIDTYYSSAISLIHNSEKEYNGLIEKINNDTEGNKAERIDKHRMDFMGELESEKQRFMDKCNKEIESIIANQGKLN